MHLPGTQMESGLIPMRTSLAHSPPRPIQIALTVVALLLASMIASPSSEARAAAVVKVKVSKPPTVPSLVRLRGPQVMRTLSVGPDTQRKIFRQKMRVPRIWVEAPLIIANGQAYEASIEPRRRFRLDPGNTTRIRIGYRPAPLAGVLRAREITRTSIDLDWRAPDGAVVQLRRTQGRKPASSVRDGQQVPATGTTALDTGLQPGTNYTYSLFTRRDGKWEGPISTTAGTASDEPGVAAYMAKSTTVFLTERAREKIKIISGGLRIRLEPHRPTPRLGSAFVLPPSDKLPGGYLGKVIWISSDGREIKLTGAGLADAFDYYDIDTDFGAPGEPIETPPPEEDPTGGGSEERRARGSDTARRGDESGGEQKSCARFSGSTTINLSDSSVDASGAFSVRLSTTEVDVPTDFGFSIPITVPTGAPVDISADLEAKLAAEIAVVAALKCKLDLPSYTYLVTVTPVPISMKVSPVATAGITAGVSVKNLGFETTAGFQVIGDLMTEDFDLYLTEDGSPLTPRNLKGNAGIELALGGSITVGPGGGGPGGTAGAIAGLRGTFLPLKATLGGVFTDERSCLKATLGLTADLSVVGEAWLGPWSATASHSLTKYAYDYAGPWYLPSNCEAQPPPPPDVTAPAVTITSPADGAIFGRDSISGVYAVDDPDATVECRVDLSAFRPCSSPRLFTELSDGEHRFSVRATDAAGNVGRKNHQFTIAVVRCANAREDVEVAKRRLGRANERLDSALRALERARRADNATQLRRARQKLRAAKAAKRRVKDDLADARARVVRYCG